MKKSSPRASDPIYPGTLVRITLDSPERIARLTWARGDVCVVISEGSRWNHFHAKVLRTGKQVNLSLSCCECVEGDDDVAGG